jgi:multidrug efflux pump subunit AcrB
MNPVRIILSRVRIFTLLVILLPIVAGVYAYQTIPKEGEPEISAPIAIVMTAYPGASPGEIESLITNPLEEALSDLKNIKEMRSSSSEGVSVVVVEFDVEADLERSLQKVREKVTDTRGDLPEEAEDPVVDEISLTDIPIMLVSIVGDVDPMHLRRLAEDTADDLELLPEVLSTDVAGGLSREIQIYVDPERLNQYGLTILDVYNAIKQSDVNIPGGLINVAQRRLLLRTLTEIKRVRDYEAVPLVQQGDKVVYLGDVAEIVDGHVEDITYSRVDGRPSVSIGIKKRAGANILETSRKVRAALAEMEKKFPAGVHTVITADQAKFIQQTFDIMNNSAVTGLIIVIIVLFFAMGLRNSIITSLSIPLSLLFTFVLLKTFGITNNNMVRFSLVLCIGLLVDNAIIVVENAYHHFQLGKDRVTAVVDGVSEIAVPVISATLTTMAAFLPMLLMTGTTGEYMSFLPKTVTIALASSLLVALVANPIVLARFMKQTHKQGRIVRPEEDLRLLKKIYVKTVTWAMNRRLLVLTISILALAGAGSLVGLNIVKIEMFPDIDFDYVYITIETPPGTDVDLTDRVTRQVEKIVRDQVPEAVRVVSTAGARGQSAFEITVSTGAESNYAEVTLELLDGKEFARATHKEIQQRIRPLLEAIPGASIRFRPLAWGPPRFAPVVVKVIGPDLDALRRITGDVKSIISSISGAADIKDDFSDAPPELQVRVDRESAASLGVPINQVAMALRGATAGLDIRDFRDELDVAKKYDLKVRYAPEARTSPRMLDKVNLRSTTGRLVPLTNIATFVQQPGVNVIRHVDRRRVVRATAQNEGRSAVEISKELQARLADYQLPPGYLFSFEGDFKETEESFASLKLAYLVAFMLIFALLVSQFDSYFQPFAIMTALPLSVVGAMIGLLVTRNSFSIMGFIGLVGLTGIVVNDSIVLVDCINRMRAQGLNIFEAIVAAGQQRLRPILSTTITTAGGIITLTITDELWEGLGVVIIFGITFATMLTLVVVPVMYSLFEGLGQNVISALHGSRWTEPPQGRTFYFTRRRYAKSILALIIMTQAAALVLGIYFLEPWLANTIKNAVIQAPTMLKLAIEALVFVLVILFQLAAALAVIMLPTWLGLLFLLWRRSQESYYIEVNGAGVTVTTPGEKLFCPAAELKYRYGAGVLTFDAGLRSVSVQRVIEDRHAPAILPLRTWLSQPAPSRAQVRAGLSALKQALDDLTSRH